MGIQKKLANINKKIEKLKLGDFCLRSNKSVNGITLLLTYKGLVIFNVSMGQSVELTELTEKDLNIFVKNFKKVIKGLVDVLRDKNKKIHNVIKILSEM